jgi:hypothetical protein
VLLLLLMMGQPMLQNAPKVLEHGYAALKDEQAALTAAWS